MAALVEISRDPRIADFISTLKSKSCWRVLELSDHFFTVLIPAVDAEDLRI